MTISMSEQSFADFFKQEIFAQAQQPDPADGADLLLPQPAWLAVGYRRAIELRQGLVLEIDNFHLCDRWEIAEPKKEKWLNFHFHLSGEHQNTATEVSNLEYALCGNGLAPKQTTIAPNHYRILEVTVFMQPDILVSFIGNRGELPFEFQHLIRQAEQKYYARVGTTSPKVGGKPTSF